MKFNWVEYLGIMSLCIGIHAQDPLGLSLDELLALKVTTVSKVEENRDEAPGVVYVFTREQIRNRGFRNLDDLLQTVPGYYSWQSNWILQSAIRGLPSNNDKITLMVNGQEINQLVEPAFLDGPISLENAERVEVIMGPSSLFEPGTTLMATVNIITRKLDGTEVVLGSGNHLNYKVGVMSGKKVNDQRFISTSFTLMKKRGYDVWEEGFREHDTDYTGEIYEPSFFSVTQFQWDQWFGQMILNQYTFREADSMTKGISDRDFVDTDAQYGLLLGRRFDLAPETTAEITLESVYKYNAREPDDPSDFSINAEGQPRVFDWNRRRQLDSQAEFSVVHTGWDRHRVQTGIQAGYEKNMEFFVANGTYKVNTVNRDTWSVGLYLSDTFQVNDRLQVVAGVRADHNTIFEDNAPEWSGRGAVNYWLIPEGWLTKVIMNRTVRFPSIQHTDFDGAGTQDPQFPALGTWINGTTTEPETLTTVEWQNIFYHNKTRLSVNLYQQSLESFIWWNRPHGNVGDYKGDGIEIEVSHQTSNRFTVWGNLAYNNSSIDGEFDWRIPYFQVNANESNDLIGSPKYIANAGLDWKITNTCYFSPSLRYITQQPAVDTQTGEYYHVNGVTFLNISLRMEDVFREGVDVQLIVRNLLDQDEPMGTMLRSFTTIPRERDIELSLSMAF